MIKEFTPLELLLSEREDREKKIVEVLQPGAEGAPLKSEKSADLDDFMEMVAMLVAKALKKDKVEFRPDEGQRPVIDTKEDLSHPVIYYQLNSFDIKGEIKPRVRELVAEEGNEAECRHGTIWGQKFKTVIQFNIIACDYAAVTRVMKSFEKLIFAYTAFFKKNGVAELFFLRRLTDKNLDMYRQTCSVRSLQYYAEIEQLYSEFSGDIAGISVN